ARRQGRGMTSVHEDGPGPRRPTEQERRDLALGDGDFAPRRAHEPGFRNGRDAREAPCLLLRGREPELSEARDRALTDLLEPRRSAPSAVRRERPEVGDVPIYHIWHVWHVWHVGRLPERRHATAAPSAVVHRPAQIARVPAGHLGLVLEPIHELYGPELLLAAMLADRVHRRAEEIGVGDAPDRDGVLERDEHAFARAVLRLHREQ